MSNMQTMRGFNKKKSTAVDLLGRVCTIITRLWSGIEPIELDVPMRQIVEGNGNLLWFVIIILPVMYVDEDGTLSVNVVRNVHGGMIVVITDCVQNNKRKTTVALIP